MHSSVAVHYSLLLHTVLPYSVKYMCYFLLKCIHFLPRSLILRLERVYKKKIKYMKDVVVVNLIYFMLLVCQVRAVVGDSKSPCLFTSLYSGQAGRTFGWGGGFERSTL